MDGDARDLIGRTRDGRALTADQISALISGFSAGDVSDEQMAAWLMAAVIRGLSSDEVVALTAALVASGETLDLSGLAGPTVDKHSTGGVADTATLVVAPLAAACGLQVTKLAGRALGHTGGTLDKLEAIPGLRVDLSPREVVDQVARVGVVVAAATDDLVPADRRLYALRDLTATVQDPGLIAASIMSKKLAGGAQHILLDVKTGDGAFMRDELDALALAQACVAIGEAHGRTMRALITDMSQPLGPAAGNALEVAAAIATLGGAPGRLRDLSLALTCGLLEATGATEVEETVRRGLEDGAAKEKFREMIEAQGGDPHVIDEPWEVLPVAPVRAEVTLHAGVVQQIGCEALGQLVHRLGAGRGRPGDPPATAVDPAVGVEVLVSVGAEVGEGEVAAVVHARTDDDAQFAADELRRLIVIGDGAVEAPALVRRRLLEDARTSTDGAA